LRRRDLVVSWLLGFSWLAGCVVAFIIGFDLTGVSATPLRPPLDRARSRAGSDLDPDDRRGSVAEALLRLAAPSSLAVGRRKEAITAARGWSI
jgi:hypothetical protein